MQDAAGLRPPRPSAGFDGIYHGVLGEMGHELQGFLLPRSVATVRAAVTLRRCTVRRCAYLPS